MAAGGGGGVRGRRPTAPSARCHCRKALAPGNDLRHTNPMEAPVLEPQKLRLEIIKRIEAMDEEGLRLVHRLLLHVEKERLWRELSAESEADHRLGKFDRLSEVVREARAELRISSPTAR